MKKILSIILPLIMCVAIIGFVYAVCGIDSEKKSGALISSPLLVEKNNEDRYNDSIYLTEDKFFFTSYDDSNSFGDSNTPYILDLMSGKKNIMFDFDIGDVRSMSVIGEYMYLIGYTYTDSADEEKWGSCLISYHIPDGKCDFIYKTPNTVQEIEYEILGNRLVILAGVDNQGDLDYDDYKLLCYDVSNEKLTDIMSLPSCLPISSKTDVDGAYFGFDKCVSNEYGNVEITGSVTYHIFYDMDIEECTTVFDETKNVQKIDDKIISANFGDYLILQDEIPNKVSDGCGYDYKIKYYLYDTANGKKQPIEKVKYWFYYA